MDREIQELTLKFNSEKISLENNNKSLRQKNDELENNLRIIINESDKLKKALDQKSFEIEELKSKNVSLETQKSKFMNEAENWKNNYNQLE